MSDSVSVSASTGKWMRAGVAALAIVGASTAMVEPAAAFGGPRFLPHGGFHGGGFGGFRGGYGGFRGGYGGWHRGGYGRGFGYGLAGFGTGLVLGSALGGYGYGGYGGYPYGGYYGGY